VLLVLDGDTQADVGRRVGDPGGGKHGGGVFDAFGEEQPFEAAGGRRGGVSGGFDEAPEVGAPGGGHLVVEDVGEAGAEDAAKEARLAGLTGPFERLLPVGGGGAAVIDAPAIDPVVAGVVLALGVAVEAARAGFGAANPWIEGVVGPGDCGVLGHVSLALLLGSACVQRPGGGGCST